MPDSPGSFTAWAAAAGLLAKVEQAAAPPVRRSVRVAVAGSYTTAQLVPLLRLAALRRGMHVAVHETGFDTYRQEILDPSSELHRFDPDYVVLAPHEGAVRFPLLTEDPRGRAQRRARAVDRALGCDRCELARDGSSSTTSCCGPTRLGGTFRAGCRGPGTSCCER